MSVVPSNFDNWIERDPFPEEGCLSVIKPSGILLEEGPFLPAELSRVVEAGRISRWLKQARPAYDQVIFSLCIPGRMFWPWFGSLPITYIHHSYPDGQRSRPGGLVYRALLSKKAQVISVSAFVQSQMARVWGFRENDPRFEVVRSTTGDSPDFEKSGRPDSPFRRVLTVGSVIDYKNPEDWIEVARRFHAESSTPKTEFVWVGDGPLLDECRRKVAELGLENTIRFVGHHLEPDNFYRESDVYLQLSHVESLSLSAVDALRWGLPVVVAKTGGLPELVGDERNGYLVDLGDISATVRGIAQILGNNELWLRMSHSSRALYSERFSRKGWETKMKRILNLP